MPTMSLPKGEDIDGTLISKFGALKSDFPILDRRMRNESRLIYLDSGATSQKPFPVLTAMDDYYRSHNAAVHRGAHLLAEEADAAFESARERIAAFIGVAGDEVVFTKSATESLNLLAYSISNTNTGSFRIGTGENIVVTEMEHHANLIPWQQLAKRTGAELRWIPVLPDGRLDYQAIPKVIDSKTKIVAFTHQSNVLGTINEVDQIVAAAKNVGALTVLDACQSAPHFAINLQELGVDFAAFSGHKMLGPTGIGVFWGKAEHLEILEPFLFGGSMIESVSMTGATWARAPRKFEAGVPNMAGAIGLGAAVDYLAKIGMSDVAAYEHYLTQIALEKFAQLSGVRVIGPLDAAQRGATISFAVEDIHPHDVGQVLDQSGIAVRTGHHCAWPLMRKFGVAGTVRASLYIYNDESDIDALIQAIHQAISFFRRR